MSSHDEKMIDSFGIKTIDFYQEAGWIYGCESSAGKGIDREM